MNPLTQQVKYELNRVLPSVNDKPSTRRAQVSAMLRFGGGFFSEGRRCWIDVELDTREAAVFLRDEITKLFDAAPRAFELSAGTFKVRQIHRAHNLAVQVGLLSPSGRPVVGMAPTVVAGTRADAAAALRGAFLARGQITTHELRRPRLEVVCPSAPAAMALIGFARRHGVQAQMREYVRDGASVDVFEIRETAEISKLLIAAGAPEAACTLMSTYSPAMRVDALEAANRCRFERAAQEQAASVRRALQILDDDVPPSLAEAAQLRLNSPTARLSELAAKVNPPITKDAYAGRIWRLLQRAENRSQSQGIGSTAEHSSYVPVR
ncbi:DNA-binding protein WhiA [Mycobacteroides abscessus]|uniref:DNA-binding protein WhiA n=1 Tax=Mycobacteroides abscessus TaxID=36809 RepID=UPI00092C0E29|nr:DNA-binding protein WhiA [Mycobacteroides abscessus]SIE00201.1 transcriptional regulator [Mycobacteroides abscessus subsp. abscessus]SKV99647.1 transcriptional regulator [Mycobacteroides abscessus subsp. abscessus]SKW39654.1 transcriptional regulator [Mycobacteroides abscessus subsp. abscessus]